MLRIMFIYEKLHVNFHYYLKKCKFTLNNVSKAQIKPTYKLTCIHNKKYVKNFHDTNVRKRSCK